MCIAFKVLRLIKAGAKIEAQANDGKTPAEYARIWRYTATARAIEATQ